MKSMEEIRAFFSGDRFALEACGITIDEVAASMAKCSMPITSMHMNANGFAQGGAIYTLCDTTFAVAANAGNRGEPKRQHILSASWNGHKALCQSAAHQ